MIEFSLHCFTRGPNTRRGEELHHVDRALHYSDSRETRIFCFDRYGLSFALPDIAKSLNQRPCFHAGRGNFFVTEPMDGSEGRKTYEVYFNVSRVNRGLLRLFVQTAYVRDSARGSSQPKRKKINFFVIAHNTRMGKEIKAPK